MEFRQGSAKDLFLTAILLCLVLLLFIVFKTTSIERTMNYQMVSGEESSENEDYQLDEFSYLVVEV